MTVTILVPLTKLSLLSLGDFLFGPQGSLVRKHCDFQLHLADG